MEKQTCKANFSDGAKKSNTKKRLSKRKQYEQVEWENLYGDRIDHFLEMYRFRIVARILRLLDNHRSRHPEIWRQVASFLKRSEVHAIIDAMFSSKHEKDLYFDVNTSNKSFWYDIDGANILMTFFNDFPDYKRITEMAASFLESRSNEYKAIVETKGFQPRIFQSRFEEIQNYFGLNEQESEILMVNYLRENTNYKIFDFYDRKRYSLFHRMAVAADMSEAQLDALLDENAPLRKYYLIDSDLEINGGIMEYLTGIKGIPLRDRFWRTPDAKALPWEFFGRIVEEHGEILADMIASKSASQGLAVLLYGAAGTGKTSFAQTLAEKLGKKLFFIAQNDEESCANDYSASFRYMALAVAQRLQDPEKSILVVDECDDMIEANCIDDVHGFFVQRQSGLEIKGMLNKVLDANRHTIIWICNSPQEAIAVSTRRRFDYSVLFDEILPETRVRIWENCLALHNCTDRLSGEFIADISRKYKVNAGGISLAVKNAAVLVAKHPKHSFEAAVSSFLQSHCALMDIHRSGDEHLEPTRDYSLDGLNIKSGIRPERIIEVCRGFLASQKTISASGRDKPRMNLLLHGVPGSGKTEFVKFLAKQLGMKLNIKPASSLLSKYVGGTERLLTSTFAEAEKNNEILFIDEGDSMLASRCSAYSTHEVSQVNTLLAEMENFSGIFIVSTNLIQNLDPAALRRFTFRVHFDYLDNAGKERFYKSYFGPIGAPSLDSSDRAALRAIPQLTPSDFRNVRQQLFYLEDENLTNTEIIEALRQEAQSRSSFDAYKGLGEEKHAIGFGA